MTTQRSPLLAIAVALIPTLWAFQPPPVGSPRGQETKSTQIEVRLIPIKKSIKAGDVLKIRVEIQNVGSKPLFIENGIYSPCTPPSPLSLQLDLGPPMKPQKGPGFGCAGDCIYSAKDSFASRLLYRWTVLPPGAFYGRVISVQPESFPQLSTPGRWRLSGTYKSIGNLSSSFCFDTAPIPDNQEQINELPYEAWQGKVDTNSVWINVARAGSSTTTKESP
ncbi:MAG: hypothetical protein WAN14_15305 [Candidatus Acidiferrales bacterium]